MKAQDPPLRRLRFCAQFCALASAAMGLAALIGWFCRSPALYRFQPGYPPMVANTACGFLLLGLCLSAVQAQWRRVEGYVQWITLVILAVAIARLIEYGIGLRLGVDQWVFHFPSGTVTGPSAERMAMPTTVGFLGAAIGVLVLTARPRRRWRDGVGGVLGIAVAFLGLAFLLGYIYGKPLGYGRGTVPMSVNSAGAFAWLGVGLLLSVASRDAAERRSARRRQAAQNAVSRVLAKFETLDEAVPRVLKTLCVNLHWSCGLLWRPGPGNGVLRCAGVWSDPELTGVRNGAKLADFVALSRETCLPRGEGLPGRAEQAGKPVWVVDVAEPGAATEDAGQDPRAGAAARAGLHAAFAVPVTQGGDFLGVLECFHHEARPPDPELIAIILTIASQIALFIKRRQAEAILRESEERTRLIIETASDAFIEADAEGAIIRWNAQAEAIFGWSREEAIGQPVATILPPQHREEWAASLRHFIKTGEWRMRRQRVELNLLRRNGKTFPVELTAWPVKIGATCRFNAFISDITARKEAEAQIAAKTAEMQRDLDFAREFQEALLPREYPRIAAPATGLALNFHHYYKPTLTVGGDFFDVIKLSDHRAGVFVADVMGHGARSALVTAILRTLLQDIAPREEAPARFLSLVNEHFLDILQRSTDLLFVSAFYLVLDVETQTAFYASAGHPSPIVAERSQKRVGPLVPRLKGNPALGVSRESSYTGFERKLHADDVFLLFTDGIFEASRADGEEFGYDRVVRLVEDNLQSDLQTLDDTIVGELHHFVGESPLIDDICLVGVEVARGR